MSSWHGSGRRGIYILLDLEADNALERPWQHNGMDALG
jgi:hypothetical protein